MPNTLRLFAFRFLSIACFALFLSTVPAYCQTNIFTYQGRLTDTGTPATGTYDLQFKLYDTATVGTGTLQGSPNTVTNAAVLVTNGVFTVLLNFGGSAFPGADRFLEINVRHPGDPSYTTLAPRYQLTSTPYSLRTLSATAADSLSAACVGCVVDADINTVSGSKVTGAVANATTAVNTGNVTGTVAIANGGTGAGNAATARTNLGLGTLAIVTPSGTGSSSNFLRGDNAWAVPAAAANNSFFNQFSNPGNLTPVFSALSGGTTNTLLGAVANSMASPCTFDAIYVSGAITSNAAADAITLTLIKNGIATSLATTINVSTINITVTGSDTNAAHSFSVAAGDTVAIKLTQTSGTPTVRLATTVHCQ